MTFVWFFCVLSLCILSKPMATQHTDVKEAFTKSGIVPDIIDTAPTKPIHMKYQPSKKQAHFGNELTPKEVKNAPHVSYTLDSNCHYTLIMVDPDAPSRADPSLRSVQHWLIVNIPGSAIGEGETLTEYLGSGPKENTGLHRYVFLVYKQPKNVKFEEPYRNKTHGSTRPGFSVKEFTSKYNLGDPVAGNFYIAQYDDSVPSLHAGLTS